jgi:hypothetical protein
VVDEIGICNHGIICLEDYMTRCGKESKLNIAVAAQLICYIYTIDNVIVLSIQR